METQPRTFLICFSIDGTGLASLFLSGKAVIQVSIRESLGLPQSCEWQCTNITSLSSSDSSSGHDHVRDIIDSICEVIRSCFPSPIRRLQGVFSFVRAPHFQPSRPSFVFKLKASTWVLFSAGFSCVDIKSPSLGGGLVGGVRIKAEAISDECSSSSNSLGALEMSCFVWGSQIGRHKSIGGVLAFRDLW